MAGYVLKWVSLPTERYNQLGPMLSSHIDQTSVTTELWLMV